MNNNQLIRFGGNTGTNVTKQAKYRVVHHNTDFAVEVMIDGGDSIRSFPTSREHPQLIEMVNEVKSAINGSPGGSFYVNEWQQVIVPANDGDQVSYYYAGDYTAPIILSLNGREFSGRPHDDDGNLLKPGDAWVGRPRPGIGYVLAANGQDVKYTLQLGPGIEKTVLLSQQVGQAARATARKIGLVKGNRGGSFYVNEYRAMFGAQQGAAGYQYVFIGMLTEQDAWFTKWQPGGPTATAGTAAAPGLATAGRANSFAIGAVAGPTAKTLEIAEDELGHSMDSLFADYMRQAKVVTIEDSYLIQSHQVANLLRFCEMLVRLGTVQTITVVTKTEDQDSHARLDSIKSSLAGHGIGFTHTLLKTLHDRRIKTDTGWEINLGRGLDIYKKPEDWHGVGATDFALRPCYHTRIVYHRLGQISTP